MPNAWDQLPDESDAAYARFMAYVVLGPNRTLEKAYRSFTSREQRAPAEKGKKRLPLSGEWIRNSSQFQWVKRAAQWDVHNLQMIAAKIVCQLGEALSVAVVNATAVLKKRPARSAREAMEFLQIVAKYADIDAAKALQAE